MTPSPTTSKSTSGSPTTGEPEYLLVGRLRRPHGLRGHLLMEVVTDFPERLRPGIRLFVGERFVPCEVVETKAHAQGILIRFDGVDNPEKAGRMRNSQVYVKAIDRPALPEGEYYHHQLLGLAVVDEGDTVLGELSEILHTGANDVYVVRTLKQAELLLPAIESVVTGIDIEAAKIRVRVPDGLKPERGRSNRVHPTRKGRNARHG